MSLFYTYTSIIFFIWIIRNTLFWVKLWQTKEYRLDRLFAHLRETSQGRDLLLSPTNILKCIGIIAYPVVVVYEAILPVYALLVSVLYTYEAIECFLELVTRRLKRPVLTGKAILLILLTVLVILGLYMLGIIQQWFLWILILDKVTTFLIAFFVFFLSVPTMLFQDYKIDLAIKKLSRFPHITVIGITGSYGKSSTKEYIAHILSQKFTVVKTKGTNNTPIGLANTVLSKITDKTEIFVTEMGAYKKGEIRQLCEIVRPKIGVLTAVGTQHLSLFGSRENIAKTKYELIEALPLDGLGIFNANNEGSYELYKKTKKRKIAYAALNEAKKIKQVDISASNVRIEKDGVSFSVSTGGTTFHCKAPLLGKQTIENILPGIYLANYFGMSKKEITDAIQSLSPLPHTMVLHHSIHNTAIVDDTFNVNPDGIIAAMQYATVYKGKKILVLEPMIELGSAAKQEHYRVGKSLAHTCDMLFLTKRNFYEEVKKGITDEKGTCQVEVVSAEKIAEYINNTTTKDDVVIFEGKEAAVSLHKIV